MVWFVSAVMVTALFELFNICIFNSSCQCELNLCCYSCSPLSAAMRMFCGSNPRLIREQGAKQLFEKMVTLSDEIYGNEDEADEEVVYAEDYEGPLKVTDDVVAVRHRASEHRRRALDSDSESDGFSAPESDFSDGDNFEDDTDSDGADSDASDEEGEFEEGEEQEYEGESEEDEKIAKTKSK